MESIPKCGIFRSHKSYTFTSPLSVRRIFAAAKYETMISLQYLSYLALQLSRQEIIK
jgi:hypothetical protein